MTNLALTAAKAFVDNNNGLFVQVYPPEALSSTTARVIFLIDEGTFATGIVLPSANSASYCSCKITHCYLQAAGASYGTMPTSLNVGSLVHGALLDAQAIAARADAFSAVVKFSPATLDAITNMHGVPKLVQMTLLFTA